MTASINVNPIQTTNAPGSFSIKSDGYIQGMAMDDPAVRFALAGGVLASAETVPMFGGIPIYEFIPTDVTGFLGSTVGRATSVSGGSYPYAGFSVFNQAHNGINTPQSPVPAILPGMGVNFFRAGSGARVVVPCDPSLVSLEGGATAANVSWDFNDSKLQPYDAATATIALTTFTWAANRFTCVAAGATPYGLGDTVYISGATNNGTGGNAAVNGAFIIDTFTDSTHFTLAAPAAAGVINVIGGSPVLNLGTGALPVKVLRVNTTNAMIVSYDAVTGYATWNRNGAAALILL